MIHGYDSNGKLSYNFKTLSSMAYHTQIAESELLMQFVKNRQVNWNGHIFHIESAQPTFKAAEPDFGYPIPKCDPSLIFAPLSKEEVDAYFDVRNRVIESKVGPKTIDEATEKDINTEKINDLIHVETSKGMSFSECFKEEAKPTAEKSKDNLGGSDGGAYSKSGSSAHYAGSFVEYIDDIELQHGTIIAYIVCEAQVTKYRGRAGKKEGVPADKDLVKANWYAACAQYLKDKITHHENLITDNVSDEEAYAFGQKYGFMRRYVSVPAHVAKLFIPEIITNLIVSECFDLSIEDTLSAKPLGTIVDEILNKNN